jgi:type IV secretion system protein VirD4
MAVSVLDLPFSTYSELYLVSVALLTALGLFGLFWKPVRKKKEELGLYPLVLDSKGQNILSTSSLHENVQIVGGTGTGKTHYVIKPFIEQTIRQDLGCFILDVKSNMFPDVAYFAWRAKGRFIRHFTLADILGSLRYNPLYGDNPDAIANRVFVALYFDVRSTEPYYRELAETYLHNLIGLLKKEIKTLTFQDLLTCTQEVDTFRTIAWFCSKFPDTHYARYFQEQWLGKSPKDRRNDLSGLLNKLQRFCNSEWSHLLNVREPDIKMEDVVKLGQVFLFSPDSARYPQDAKPLCILAMMDLAEKLADRYRATPQKPFRVFLDEFYNLAYPKFIDFINKCREAQVNLFLAHQSLGDLRGVSEEFLEQVMNTASNKIILRVNDPDTAESFSRQFGTELDREARVTSYKADHTLAGYSVPITEKFRFHPNRIKELKVGQAIVKAMGESGVRIFQTNLRQAGKRWEGFNPNNALAYRSRHEGKNESSIPQLIQEVAVPVGQGSKRSIPSLGEESND